MSTGTTASARPGDSDPMTNQDSIRVGDVLRLNDLDTGFSSKDVLRWCIVTAVIGSSVRVAGRSTTREDGFPIPKDVMPEFDLDGRVPPPPLRVSLRLARGSRNIGQLPSPWLEQLLFFMNEDIP